MSKTKTVISLEDKVKLLNAKINRHENYLRMNHKYITMLFAEVQKIKEEMKNSDRSADSTTDRTNGTDG